MAKNPISELHEVIALLHGTVSWSWLSESAPFRASVAVTLPSDPAPIAFAGAPQPSKQEAKASAALQALERHLRAYFKPTNAGPPQDCVSLLTSFCAKHTITITVASNATSLLPGKLHGFRASLHFPSGDERHDWFFAEASYTSLSLAKRDAARRALAHLLRHPLYGAALLPHYNKLPPSERAQSTSISSALPDLLSPQVLGERFRAADGNDMPESRHLECKGSHSPLWQTYLENYLIYSRRRDVSLSVAAYLTSFLNAGIAGRFVLGVSDSGAVEGVPMTDADADALSKAWAAMQARIWPPIPHGSGLLPEPRLIPVMGSALCPLDTRRYVIVFEAHPCPGVQPPYFVSRDITVAYKKVEATHTAIPADELVSMIVSAAKAGASV